MAEVVGRGLVGERRDATALVIASAFVNPAAGYRTFLSGVHFTCCPSNSSVISSALPGLAGHVACAVALFPGTLPFSARYDLNRPSCRAAVPEVGMRRELGRGTYSSKRD